jgi:EAL domain-containing protein (putative c-di-GMP-specific phosphodiesterase class I)
MLHSINFFRQPEAGGADLYLNVHDRLLGAVSSNHGFAFRRILTALGLPIGQVVLQLPAVNAARRWQLNFVADNYRRNGFRVACNVLSLAEAANVLAEVRPYVVKIDAGTVDMKADLDKLMQLARGHDARLIFKHVESEASLALLTRASVNSGVAVYVQGCLSDSLRAAFLMPMPTLPLGRAGAATGQSSIGDGGDVMR